MKASGWHNGGKDKYSPAGYGIRISHGDRDTHFDRSWTTVTVQLEGGPEVRPNITPSFWRGCSELRLSRIGRWMIDLSLAPWPKGDPPRFELEPTGEATFKLRPRK